MKDVARFTDVFAPYLGDQFDTDKGVLFRLPLRTREQAQELEEQISSAEQDPRMLASRLRAFLTQEAASCLLFLKNLRRIVVSEVDPETGRLAEVGQASAKLSANKNEKDLSEFHSYLRQSMEELRRGVEIQQIKPRQTAYLLNIKVNARGSEEFTERWSIVQQMGFSDCENFSDHLTDKVNCGDIGLTPCGGVAYRLAYKKPKSRVFCLLPLKMETVLSYHVNAHFALNYESRDGLISREASRVKSEWNDRVLEKIVAPCVATLMQSTVDQAPESAAPEEIRKWPPRVLGLLPHDAQTELLALSRGVYGLLHKEERAIFPVIQAAPGHFNKEGEEKLTIQWHSSNAACFDPEATHATFPHFGGTFPSNSSALRATLKRCGLPIVSGLPQIPIILKHFAKLELAVRVLQPTEVLKFLRDDLQLPLPSPIEDTPFHNSGDLASVVKYVLQIKVPGETKDADPVPIRCDQLSGLPIMLSDRGTLGHLQRNVLYQHWDSALLPKFSDKFVHYALSDLVKADANGSVFKQLMLADLATMLDQQLDQSVYKRGADVPFGHHPKTDEHQARIFVDGDKAMTLRYFRKLWIFFMENVRDEPAKLLGQLGQWSLLPCVRNRQLLLTPLRNAGKVFDSATAYDLATVLRQLPLCHGFCDLFDSSSDYSLRLFYMGLLSDFTTKNASQVTAALLECLESPSFAATTTQILKQDDVRTALLAYFTKASQAKSAAATLKLDTLRWLPLFKHFDGTIGPIESASAVVMPQRDDVAFFSVADCDHDVLQYDVHAVDLYSKMGLEFLTFETAYTTVILPQYGRMSWDQRKQHLVALSNHYTCLRSKAKEGFAAELAGWRLFHGNGSSTLVMASELFDKTVEVVKHMEPDKVIADCYVCKEVSRDFLQDLNLKTQLGRSDVLRLAQRLATENIHGARDLLLQAAFENPLVEDGTSSEEREYLKKLGRIKFLTPETTSDLANDIKFTPSK